MSFYHGITVQETTSGSRTIEVPAASVIGLTGTFTPVTTGDNPTTAVIGHPTKITTLAEARAAFGADDGTNWLAKAFTMIYAQAKCVVVCVGAEAGADDAATKSALIGGVETNGQRHGIEALLDAKSVTDLKPYILVSQMSDEQAVAAKLGVIADRMRAVALIAGPSNNDDDAVAYAAEFGSKRQYMVDPAVKIWDTATDAEIIFDPCPSVAGVIALSIGERGYWASPSNREIKGILGTQRAMDNEYGDEGSRANLLNNANVATIVRDGGYKLWGNRTLSSDSKWAFLSRVMTCDTIYAAIQAGHQWAVDLGITKTYVADVTEGLQEFMTAERAKGAIINFEAWVDKERSTASEMAQGRVYWNIRFTDVPPAENPVFSIEVTNDFLTEVLS